MTSRSLRNDVAWSFAELITRYGIQFVTLIVLARLVSPQDFGYMAIAMVGVGIGNVLADSGMTVALTRLTDASPDHFASARVIGVISGIACVGLALLVGQPLTRALGAATSYWLLVAATLTLPFIGATTAPDASLIRHRRFGARARAQGVASLASSAAAIAMALAGYGAWSLVVQMVVAAVARWALLTYLARLFRGRVTRSALRDILPLSGFLVLSGILDAIALRMQAALLGRIFGPVDLGYYAQAQNIQQVPTTAFSATVNKVGLTHFAAADAAGTLAGTFRVFLRGCYFAFAPAMVLLAVLGRDVVPLALGDRWLPMVPVFGVLCVAAALWPIHVLNLLVCMARGEGRAFFRLEVMKKLVLVVAVALIGWRSPLDMALAVLLASLAGAAINASYSGRALGVGPLSQARALAATTLATAAAAAAAAVPGLSFPEGLARPATMAAVFVITYAVCGFGIGRRILTEWRQLSPHPIASPS